MWHLSWDLRVFQREGKSTCKGLGGPEEREMLMLLWEIPSTYSLISWRQMPTQRLVPGKSISPSIPGAVGVSCSCCSKWPQIRRLKATVPAVRSISGRKPRCWWDGAPSRGPQGDSSSLSHLLVAIGASQLVAPWLQCTPLWSRCLLLFRLCVCLLCAVTKFKLHLDNRGWAHLEIFNCMSAKVLFSK